MRLERIFEKIKEKKNNEDILDYLDIPYYESNWLEYDFYQEKLNNLPKGNYFISDLDGTFYRGFLIEFVIIYFIKFVRKIDILKLDLVKYERFLEDVVFFYKIKHSAHNKQINYNLYVECGLYILLKYANLINWISFIASLKEELNLHMRVNPYKFSIKKLLEEIDKGNYFLFVSGASHFVFELYIDLLKNYIKENYGEKYSNKIYGFSSYANPFKELYNLFSQKHKFNFIKELKETGKLEKIVGGMGDTNSDFGISYHIENNGDFFFINPDLSVIENYQKYKQKNINYHFINERKNLIFEYNLDTIKLLNE